MATVDAVMASLGLCYAPDDSTLSQSGKGLIDCSAGTQALLLLSPIKPLFAYASFTKSRVQNSDVMKREPCLVDGVNSFNYGEPSNSGPFYGRFGLVSIKIYLIIHPMFDEMTDNQEPFELSCIMPSLQTALPPELANNAIRLYRECLRRAKYIGSKQHNTQLLVGMVRQQFKKHMHETDPDKIQKLKDDAARGLINHMLHESEKITGRKFSQGS
ncbi:hypothetical protein KY290_022064 [Solanum tuberosum]|uniref:Complex 1 LYR protein domain-containing protein n=2 Tax=Solanum tuberosum TaxID=4113 RepID=A0ABQ7V595_SOLTU|nr:hypothetical protein KY290_022064 [Solanum tuberosum]